MTIAISCCLPDGVVMGTDSAVTVHSQDGVVNVFTDAPKLFQLETQFGHGGIATFGTASFGGRTVASYVREFNTTRFEDKDFPSPPTVHDEAALLHDFFADKGEEGVRLPCFHLAGYTYNEHLPELYAVDPNAPKENGGVVQKKAPGVTWDGVTRPVERVHRGLDRHLIDDVSKFIGETLAEAELPELTDALAMSIVVKLHEMLETHHFFPRFSAMPVQQGIDYVRSLLHITIAFCRFIDGAPICDKPIKMAVITPDQGYQEVTDEGFQVRAL